MEILIRNVTPEELNTLDKEKFDWYSEDDTYNNIIISLVKIRNVAMQLFTQSEDLLLINKITYLYETI